VAITHYKDFGRCYKNILTVARLRRLLAFCVKFTFCIFHQRFEVLSSLEAYALPPKTENRKEKSERSPESKSVTEIPLSPIVLKSDTLSGIPAVVNVDPAVNMNDAAVVTSENLNGALVITERSSSVIELQSDQSGHSAFCGQLHWKSCIIA